jgi:hypothetical protein
MPALAVAAQRRANWVGRIRSLFKASRVVVVVVALLCAYGAGRVLDHSVAAYARPTQDRNSFVSGRRNADTPASKPSRPLATCKLSNPVRKVSVMKKAA